MLKQHYKNSVIDDHAGAGFIGELSIKFEAKFGEKRYRPLKVFDWQVHKNRGNHCISVRQTYYSNMAVSYKTPVIGDGNHASLLIPDEILAKLGANRRAPLKITINGHTYRSTSTGVGGECRVVFPQAERDASGAVAGDLVQVTLELELGHRDVELSPELEKALKTAGLRKEFEVLTYSRRKEFARQVSDAKSADTRLRRIQKVLESL